MPRGLQDFLAVEMLANGPLDHPSNNCIAIDITVALAFGQVDDVARYVQLEQRLPTSAPFDRSN